MPVLEYFSVYIFGALGYGLIEILWRGHTHWTMLVLGGACFVAVYIIANFTYEALWKKWLMCGAVITTLEFLTGVLVNLRLGWSVWDYSGVKLNLCGQICATYSLFWVLLSIPAVWLCRLVHAHVFAALAGG